ncbi:MAG: bifunctional ornithine acetyltransferase/N-acetylglutamate synthase [Spirochaetes bacterium RBG_13_51_14]|nr:MAG: bifunctional ornithine acetyltransferase/N-acetylglutamate synthase [Spirochaetes bacterium RBG_13_51_14]
MEGGLENIKGFAFSALECGIRYPGRLDYCLMAADHPCSAAGVFTTNQVSAAPVKLCRERIANPVRAILINATNANACTGIQGYHAAEELTGDIAARLGAPAASVLMASTGIIGRQLPFTTMMDAHQKLVESLSRDNGRLIPKAIMTTDTVPKQVCVSFNTSAGTFSMAGTAKGAGMIAPDMATLLCFIISDAPVERRTLAALFRKNIGATLNAITIDGDMSTNDTAIILSPRSDAPLTADGDLNAFEEALHTVLARLSEMLIDDGEGTTKRVRITVKNAKSDADATRIARAIAESLLVKTAFFGNDPNWGRIAAAAGRSGAAVDEQALSISFDDMSLLARGTPVEFDPDGLVKIMAKKTFEVTVDIGLGESGWSILTTDISLDYVRINAEYST